MHQPCSRTPLVGRGSAGRIAPICLLLCAALASLSEVCCAVAFAEDVNSGKPNEPGSYSINVRPLLPDGQPTGQAYLTLWRALEPYEKDPVNHINGPQGFGYYDPVIWNDEQHDARWVRFRSAGPNDGRHARGAERFGFADLPAGRYRVTVVSYRGQGERPDPTPYGATPPILLSRGNAAGAEAHTHSVKVRMAGSVAIVLRVLDAETRKPIRRLALRLRAADGMPIVHGSGSGNFFERTSHQGEVTYDRLPPGDYTVQVLGKHARVNDFVQYQPIQNWIALRVDDKQPADKAILVPPRKLDAKEIERRFPFYVHGRVTDEYDAPLADVPVRAATGVGTLGGGGSTQTDNGGRYRLYFNAGMRIMSDGAPLGVGVQAALISARKPGWYEINFNRQGNLAMSDQTPAALTERMKKRGPVWSHTTIDEIVFPGVPREVNFTLAPSAVIEGTLRSDGSREITKRQLYLTGDDLPPGSNVLDSVTTGRNGEFRIDGVPVGRPWRFGIRVVGTRNEIETQPFTLDRPGVHRCEVSLETEYSDDGAATPTLRYQAADER